MVGVLLVFKRMDKRVISMILVFFLVKSVIKLSINKVLKKSRNKCVY